MFVPGRGELRQTVEVGPGAATARGRVMVRLELSDTNLVAKDTLQQTNTVSVRELSIPPQAWREYDEAARKLARRDIAGAVANLEQAVKIAPQFGQAWNTLGTISYKNQQYSQAASHFRRSLEAEPEAYEPLVNLGGVLLNLEQPQEALGYNRHAVLRRPNDALANSQLGLTYFLLGEVDRALKHLNEAKRLDPAHFSHPQLTLAEIYLQRKDTKAASAELEDFLRRHPDHPKAESIRQGIRKLSP